jgi:hypothetical protein
MMWLCSVVLKFPHDGDMISFKNVKSGSLLFAY